MEHIINLNYKSDSDSSLSLDLIIVAVIFWLVCQLMLRSSDSMNLYTISKKQATTTSCRLNFRCIFLMPCLKFPIGLIERYEIISYFLNPI